MLKLALLAGAALIGSSFVVAPEVKAFTVIGTESSTDGFVGNMLEQNFPGSGYLVASDGESPFDPFHAGYDTSDGLNFSAVPHVWTQAADSTWTDLGHQTWVLPAVIPGCGAENEPRCEPPGHFVSPDPWVEAALGTYVILDWPGDPDYVFRPGWSDVLIAYNDANGANLLFYSDSVPEASTWVLMALGFAGLGFAGYRYKKSAAFVA